MSKAVKPKKCRSCGEQFIPFRTTDIVCSVQCAMSHVEKQNKKRVDREAKEQRKKDKQRKQALKTKSEWLAETQTVCNKYIRERDKYEPCITCKKYDHEIDDIFTGGKWDAGHWQSRGAHPELRFHPYNIHKQCKKCNGGSGKFSHKRKTVGQNYDENVLERIGQQMYDYLEGPQQAQNWSIEDIKEIKQYYKEQLKVFKDE